jgi:sulfoxide reductase heme-binding subunit YedZ
MTPLNTYFGWNAAIKLRKSAGLWAFGFACLHVLFYIREAELRWLTISMPFYLMLGVVGISILTILACTSNRWPMQRLGKNWKRLHRLVYVAGCAVATHSVLATTMSKKIFARDPQALSELKVYVAILCMLLVVRIPLVRTLLKQVPILLKSYWKPVLPVRPIVPNREADLWPKIYAHESDASLEPSFVIPNEMSSVSEQSNLDESLPNVGGPSDGDADSLGIHPLPEVEGELQ